MKNFNLKLKNYKKSLRPNSALQNRPAPPKRSLGQNFLTSVGAINKMVDIAVMAQTSNITIVEVGPGRGVLTEALLKKFDHVIAIEKDRELIKPLMEKFTKEIRSNKLKIIEGDALDLEARLPSKYAVVANIPYYITGQFLRKWLSLENQPKYMVLMLQKEVAQRIVAKNGKGSLLSISVKTYGKPTYVETVKKGSFYPIPSVDSAILKIEDISKDFFDKQDEGRFFSLLKYGFAHKRKLLRKNLEDAFRDKELIEKAFKSCRLSPLVRPENLKTEDWFCLAENILTAHETECVVGN